MNDPLNSAFMNDPEFQSLMIDCLETLQRGESVNRDAIRQNFPKYAEDLDKYLEVLQVLDRFSGSLPQFNSLVNSSSAYEATITPHKTQRELESSETIRYIGEYEVLEEIARGGMGVVFKARQASLKRIVALKMILSGQLADSAEIDRFRREAQAASRLQHPNIVPVHEIGEHNGRQYFTMDYVDGHSLADEIREESLAPKRAAKLVKTIAEAVQFAHGKDTLHRDLKPANVLLTDDDEPHVTDFGLAKILDEVDEGSGADLTASGQILGTPSYMSPEQAEGIQSLIGPATDIYSLGAILYACLTGRAPFVADSPVDTLMQVIKKEPVPPRQLNPSVPKDLETICLKCLNKERHKRYGTAKELAEDLERFVEGRPVLARPIGRFARTWRWAKRNPAVASLICLVALSMIVGTTISSVLAIAEHSQRLIAQQAEIDAKIARREALSDRDAAEESREIAETNRAHAINSEQQTAAALKKQRLISYSNGIQLAHRAYLAGEYRRASELIDECPEEHRHWEWRYLCRLLRSGRTIFEGPIDELLDVAISPDGQLAIAVSTTHLWGWDAETGEKQFAIAHPKFEWPERFERPQKAASGFFMQKGLGIGFSPKGDRFALARKQITIFDAKDRRELSNFFHPNLNPRCVTFDSEGKRVAGAGTRANVGGPHGSAGGIVIVWDLETGEELYCFDDLSTSVMSVAFSPDGRLLAASTTGASGELPEPGEVQIWNLEQEVESRILRVKEGITPRDLVPSMLSVAFEPNGSRLAAGCADGKVYLWNTSDWERSLIFESSKSGNVKDLDFSTDGRMIATVSYDRVVRVHNAASGKMINTFQGHVHPLEAVSFLPDYKRLLSVGGYRRSLTGQPGEWDMQGEAIAWQLDSVQGRRVINGRNHLFHPDWNFVVSGNLGTGSPPGNLTIHDLPSCERRDFTPPHGYAAKVSLTQKGELLAASTHRGGAQIWNTDNGQLLALIPDGPPVGHDWYARMVAVSADGRRAATKFNGTLILWDIDSPPKIDGVPTATEIRHFEPVWGAESLFSVNIQFSPDGKSFVLPPQYSEDKQTRFIVAETGKERFISPTNKPVFTSDRKKFVFWELEQGFLVLDAENGRILIRGGGEELSVDKFSLAPNDRFIAAETKQATVIWDLIDQKALWSIEREVTSNVAFDAASQRFACCTIDGSILFGNLETGETIVSRADDNYLTIVAITHDGRRVAASSSRGSNIRFWETNSGYELMTFTDANPDRRYPIRSLKFSPCDQLLATTGPPLVIWDGQSVD